MRIFVDMHHSTLFKSLQMLLEDRLGHELYRPIGKDWFEEGYWKLAEPYDNNLSTIEQYLGLRDFQPVDGSKPLNPIEEVKPDYYLIADTFKPHKAITLEQFKRMEFDIIIASYDKHIEPYQKLLQFQPKAKFVFQIGNDWPVDFTKVKNLMASVAPYEVPKGINAVFYHQEIDTNLFSYHPPVKKDTIRSFVNCLQDDLFKTDWRDFLWLERTLPFRFRSFGGGCRDGIIQSQEDVAKLMQDSFAGVHLKTGGDGFGHVLFNWFAVGRPVIVRKSQYKGKLADKLLTDETCFDLDKGMDYVVDKINTCDHPKMCETVYNKFISEVNFNREAEDVKSFIDKCKN
jgi:hypothetical protein